MKDKEKSCSESSKGWVKETYERAAKQVAEELSLLTNLILEEQDNDSRFIKEPMVVDTTDNR